MSRYPHFSPIHPTSRPLPHGAELSKPSVASHVDSTMGRCRGSVSSVRALWVPNIKEDREFAVPIRASRSKPGAGRIKAQSHLPANPPPGMLPPRHCFLFLPTGKMYNSHSNIAAHRVPHPHAGRSGRPTFPILSINPTSKGLSQCLLSCTDAGALGQRKGLVSTLEAWS